MVVRISQRPRHRLKWAMVTSFCVGGVLLATKFTAYFLTGSEAILSDATESIVNVVAAAFAFYSLRVASRPPDEEHPYGHGKAEFFSAAFEGVAIIIAALWIIYKAVQELIAGPDVHQLDVGIWLIVASTVVNLGLGYYLVRLGKRNDSIILVADGKHILTDVFTSAGVVIGLVVMYFTEWFVMDSIIAIIVALVIIRTGYYLVSTSAKGMMDCSCSEDEAVIKNILDNVDFENVCGYHKLRHRHSGGMHFVDFHLIFPRHMTIEEAHTLATIVETRVADALGDAGVMAHIEPCRRQACPNCSRKI